MVEYIVIVGKLKLLKPQIIPLGNQKRENRVRQKTQIMIVLNISSVIGGNYFGQTLMADYCLHSPDDPKMCSANQLRIIDGKKVRVCDVYDERVDKLRKCVKK